MNSSIDVHNCLQGLEIPHEFFKLGGSASSLEVAAEAAGVELREIARVEVYFADEEPVLVIYPGDREIDTEKLKSVTGAISISKAQPDEIPSITGYHSNSVPPVGLTRKLQVFIDYYTLREDVVYTGSGDAEAILKIRSYDLVRATGGEIVRLTGED